MMTAVCSIERSADPRQIFAVLDTSTTRARTRKSPERQQDPRQLTVPLRIRESPFLVCTGKWVCRDEPRGDHSG